MTPRQKEFCRHYLLGLSAPAAAKLYLVAFMSSSYTGGGPGGPHYNGLRVGMRARYLAPLQIPAPAVEIGSPPLAQV